jgi:hypothetical protein
LNGVLKSLNDGSTVVNNGRKSATSRPAQGLHFDSTLRASDFVQRFECKSLCTEIVEDPLATTTYFHRYECRSTLGGDDVVGRVRSPAKGGILVRLQRTV